MGHGECFGRTIGFLGMYVSHRERCPQVDSWQTDHSWPAMDFVLAHAMRRQNTPLFAYLHPCLVRASKARHGGRWLGRLAALEPWCLEPIEARLGGREVALARSDVGLFTLPQHPEPHSVLPAQQQTSNSRLPTSSVPPQECHLRKSHGIDQAVCFRLRR